MSAGTEAALASSDDAVRARRLLPKAAKLWGEGTRKGALSVADQTLVSGASFLTTILIGRTRGPEELGVYLLVYTLMMLAVCAHQSLLMTPYTIYVNRLPPSQRREYTGSVLVHHGLFTALAMLGMGAAGVVLSRAFGSIGLASAVWMLAAALPFVLLKEFGRRFSFAHLRLAAAIGVDGTAAAVQLAGLAALAALGLLSAGSAFAALGVGCALAGFVGLALARREIAFRREKWLPQLRQNWTFGRWTSASQLTLLIHSYLIHWLLALMCGAAATGIFAACKMIVDLCNPFILGMENMLNPWIARSYASEDGGQARRMVGKATLILGGAMGAFFLVMLLLGGWLVRLFYGEQYAGHAWTIWVLAAGVWVSSLGMAAGHGLWAMEKPKVNFVASLVGMGVTLLAGVWLVGPWGSLGAAWAWLAGNVAASALLAAMYLKTAAERAAPRLAAPARETQCP
jgi:O-antigen/teichoic acid export membrane protein